MAEFELRAYVFIDRMQPQFSAVLAAQAQGDVPVAGMSDLYVEVAPGNEILRVADVALKAADVRPASQVIEREFGMLELHSRKQAEVLAAGQAILEHLGHTEGDATPPQISSTQLITNVDPYQAQLINKFRRGSLLLPGTSLFVLECAPAAYVCLAANEAEKAASITVVEIRAVGRFGRLLVSGTESDVQAAGRAAAAALAKKSPR